ncbi:peptidase [Aliidiomarina taiwanensis]|uniref:Peptidase n=1 Tax=Aliidiomarina taiwanensis TaxID=946228 RepID=A0A432X8C6_9GAMM|nr:zinc-dependent metalloprotease [Aliidiomarina taiwanensis]RUO43637.1 peptidase [Aliidiomarina taiwanensis]
MLKRILAAFVVLLVTTSAVKSETIDKFTQGMEQLTGYYTLYVDSAKDKVYVQVPRHTEPFLFQSSLPRGVGSNDLGLDRGQLGRTRIVQFSVHGERVLLTQQNTTYVAITENEAERLSVQEAFAESVLYGFEVAASNDQGVLIDYTPFLKSDIHNLANRLKAQNEGNFKVDASRSVLWLDRTKSFPKNTELEAKVTFTGDKAGRYVRSVTPDAAAITVHMHHSFVELPPAGYTPRAFHPNSGYYSRGFQNYAAPLGESMDERFIARHRLEKKNPEAERSEAVEPIVYYLDPGAPEPVRSALLDGARWWAQAFEQLGYIDAFRVEILPEDADPMDVRYNVIQWVHRATRGWSYGASVVDPRTGEIIKGHVSLGSLRVRQDMLIAQGVLPPYEAGVDTEARLQAIEDMAISRIRQLSAHEIGHTLGIAHNFAASPQNRASVMDYPHPLIELDENGELSIANAYDSGLGPWDMFAVAYGYQEFASEEAEREGLATLLQEAADKGYAYISDRDARPVGGGHATAHLWDNGESPSAELMRIADIRQRILANFGAHNLAPGRPLDELEQVLVPMYLLHRYQVDATAKHIAGMHYRYYVNGEGPVDYRPVSGTEQAQALAALLHTLTPEFLQLPAHIQALLVPKAMGSWSSREDFKTRMGLFNDPVTMAEGSANFTLTMLLNAERLNRLHWQSQQHSDIAGVQSLLQQLTNTTLAPLKDTTDAIGQRVAYVTLYRMAETMNSEETAPEVRALVRAELTKLHQQLDRDSRKRRFASKQAAAHLAHCLAELLSTGEWPESFTAVELPPGSPI